MSYIKITETEQLSSLTFDTVENAVLVFGLGYNARRLTDDSERIEARPADVLSIGEISEPTLFETLSDFRSLINFPVTLDGGNFVDRSAYVANDCLAMGLPVLFVPVDKELEYLNSETKKYESVYDADGYLKSDVIDSEGNFYFGVTESQIARAINSVAEKNEFDISDKINCPVKFITTSGYSVGDTISSDNISRIPTITYNILRKLGDRLDVIVLADFEPTIKPVNLFDYHYFFNIAGEVDEDGSPLTGVSDLSSNVACTYPWGTYSVYFDRTQQHMPGSYGQLMAFANSIKNNATWMAAAGTTRGIIPNIIATDYKVSEALQRLWQGETTARENEIIPRFRVNPIMNLGSYGTVVFGNRTCYDVEDNNRTTQTFKKFLSVRLLLVDIHKMIHKVSLTHTFEPNDDILWLSYKQGINDLLDKMISGRGIQYYRWYKLKTQALSKLKAKLIIRPIETVEEFEINIHMTDQEIDVIEGGE